MKIVHVCISAPYIDGWGYQENLLPKYLQNEGIENYVLASACSFPRYITPDIVLAIINKGVSYEIDGVKITRIKTTRISSSFIITRDFYKQLNAIHPDVIIHHNFNITTLPLSAKYSRINHIPLLVDNHADTINMTKNKLWSFVYYKMMIRLTTYLHRKQISKAYGVTKARCDFIHDYYGLNKNKIDFLPIGADVELAKEIETKESLKKHYGFGNDEFIVVSGGKMGIEKGTDKLIKAVGEVRNQYPCLRLVLFGSYEDEETRIQAENSKYTIFYGWCDRIKTLELLKIADVACWPLHHTTLIEDAVSVCTPLLIRKTGTTEHLIRGNGLWIDDKKSPIEDCLLHFLTLTEAQKAEIIMSCKKMNNTISYRAIAKKLIKDIEKLRR